MNLSTRVSLTLSLLLFLAGTAHAQRQFPNWHQAVVDWSSTDADEAYYRSDDSALLAWGETYILQAYLWMYQTDTDTLWLHKLWEHATALMASARDVPLDSTADSVYYDGFRGWGTSRYSERYEEWLVHDGHLCSELARFVKLVYRDDTLYAAFGNRADSLLKFLEENIAAKWYSVWDHPRAQPPGEIDMNATYSHWIGGDHLLTFPVNHFAAFGDFALQLLEASQTAHYLENRPELPSWYRRVVEDVADAFRAVLKYDPVLDAYVWPYAAGWGNNDLSHAAIELRFAFDCYQAGMLFDDRDMLRFAHTLTRLLWANPPDIWNAQIFSDFERHGDTDFGIYSRNWPLLGLFVPLAYAVEAGVLRPFAEERQFPSSSPAAAMANLAYVARQAPPLSKAVRVRLHEFSGDGDNVPDPGETLGISLQLANWGPPIDSLILRVHCSDPRVQLLDSVAVWPQLAALDTVWSAEPLFRFREKPDVANGGAITCRLNLSARGRLRRDSLTLQLNPVPVLLVDDDGGNQTEAVYVHHVLDEIVPYQVWPVDLAGCPGAYLEKYEKVVWFTGHDRETLSAEDRLALARYLDNGGKLVLFGPRVEDDLLDGERPDTTFFVNYLHARPSDKAAELPFLTLIIKDTTLYPSPFLTLSPESTAVFRAVEPGADAYELARYSFGPAAICTNGRHRLVYLSFGLEQVSSRDRQIQIAKRRRVLQGTFALLEPPTGVQETASPPTGFSLRVFPNPAQGPIQIVASGVGRKPVRVSVYDLCGRLIRHLANTRKPRVRWDGRDNAGRPLPSGVYIVRLEAGGRVATRKVVLVR